MRLPTYQDVQDAAKRIEGVAHHTPVLTSRFLNEILGCEVFFKCENLQRVGAFKFRGAFNALSKFTTEQKQNGVIAFSSGNHAQGVALAAKILNIPAIILMPEDAPKTKVEATQGYGATVIFYDRYTQNREQIGQQIAQEKSMKLIPSYDHADVIAGQGTSAKELFEEVPNLDRLFVGLGGGGLLAGTLLSTQALQPSCQVFGVEPQAGNDGQQSLKQGKIIHIDTPQTIADGAQVQHLGELTFPIIQTHVQAIDTVTDDELKQAMRFFAERMKIVVEPTGCLGLAAIIKNKAKLKGKRIGCMITGGNIDLERYATLLTS